MQIAILECNTDDSVMASRHPSLGQLMAEGLRRERPDWQITLWAASQGALPPDDTAFDAVLLSGSVASANDEAPWMQALEDLVRRRHAAQRAIGGLCFGHQLIAKALGGRVGPSPGGWRVGVAPTQITQPQPWMQPAQPQVLLHAVHQEQVLEAPPGVQVIGGDAHAPVGAVVAGQHLFTSQYHPELPTVFLEDLFAQLGDHFPPEVVARGQVDITRPEPNRDAALLFRWLAQWIEQARAA